MSFPIFDLQIFGVKLRNVAFIIVLIIIVDQALKIWIKTTYPTGHVADVLGSKFQLYFVENSAMAWGWWSCATEWERSVANSK